MLAFFSVRLKKLRAAKNLTQRQLGAHVGVSRSEISSYENDMRLPSYEILVRLASIFGVSTDYLLGIDERRVLDISDLSEQEAAAILEMVRLFRLHHPK